MRDMIGSAVWLTGLSGSGKTTIAEGLRERLLDQGRRVEVLDGDEVRKGLSADLGFSESDRKEHNRRVIYVAKLLAKNGIDVIIPLISPYRETRAFARAELPNFTEVWVKCSIEECMRRDPKGLYARALAGEISDLTGLQAPYEEPLAPEVVVDTEVNNVANCVDQILMRTAPVPALAERF